MKYTLFYLLCSALIPELGADISTGSSCDIHLILVGIAAIRALPYKFAAFIFDDFYLTIITTALAVITFSVKFGIHNIVVNIFDYFKYGINVVFKVWNFNIAYCSTRREFLEPASNFNLSKAFIGSVT